MDHKKLLERKFKPKFNDIRVYGYYSNTQYISQLAQQHFGKLQPNSEIKFIALKLFQFIPLFFKLSKLNAYTALWNFANFTNLTGTFYKL